MQLVKTNNDMNFHDFILKSVRNDKTGEINKIAKDDKKTSREKVLLIFENRFTFIDELKIQHFKNEYEEFKKICMSLNINKQYAKNLFNKSGIDDFHFSLSGKERENMLELRELVGDVATSC